MRTRLGSAGAALLIALTLTSCGERDATSEPEPSSTPSPTAPAGLDTTPPTPPSEMARTPAGAAAYGEYFTRLVQHAVRTRNVRPVMGEALDQARCTTCRQLSEFIEGLRDDGIWEVGPDLELREFSARAQGDVFKVTGAFRYPPAQFVTISGTKEYDAGGGRYDFAADLSWDGDRSRWRVLDYTFLNKSPG